MLRRESEKERNSKLQAKWKSNFGMTLNERRKLGESSMGFVMLELPIIDSVEWIDDADVILERFPLKVILYAERRIAE